MPKRTDVLSSRFNPRPPRGGRRRVAEQTATLCGFNPRPPRGGRHTLNMFTSAFRSFNPRPPRGGRLLRETELALGIVVSIRAPRVGGDGPMSGQMRR